MMKLKSRILCLLLTTAMITSLCGCGNKNADIDNNSIELIDPVGISTEYAVAELRDMTVSSVYGGIVLPEVAELGFNSSQAFLGYGALPGDFVKKGDAVVLASTERLDDQIKNLKESMSNNRDNNFESVKDIEDEISKVKSDVANYEQINKNFASMNEDEQNAYPGGYEIEYSKYRLLLMQASARLQRLEENLKETNELFALDSSYNQTKLNELTRSRKNLLATAPIDGTVVAINYYDRDNWIEKEAPVAGVADLDKLCVRTEFVIKSDVKRASDIYAIVNGKRYEVTYLELEADEYNRLLEKNDVVYSTFYLNDPDKEVKAGDFATIVLVKSSKPQVVTVPKDAVNKDEEGYFVYKLEGEKTTYTPVKTGITFGYYTEITSGIEAGDKVVSQMKITTKKKTAKVEKGDFLHEFTGTGYLFYPKREKIKNPVEYGVTYIQELCVSNYQLVEKGDVIAKVSVAPDNLEIERQERYLLRANEELAKLEKDNKEGSNDKLIKMKKESIDEMTKLINDMKRDAATTVIRAPFTGIITSTYRWEEGNILRNGETMAEIADETNSYVVVEDSAGQLSYGNQARITYDDASGNKREVVGDVITVSHYALSKALKTGYALIKVSPEDLENMAGSSMGYEGWWNRNRFSISVYTRSTNNVVLIPKSAVVKQGDATYVITLDSNGEPTYKSFVAGGYDNSYYWVAEGLTEGTEICLE